MLIFFKQPPYITPAEYDGKHFTNLNGFSIQLMNVLQHRMNYT